MRKLQNIGRVCVLAAVLLSVLLIPEFANAKWSKASSKFKYNGVSVEVVDRHHEIGKIFKDTYGYTVFTNGENAVSVNWKCYGVLKKGGKLVCVDSGNFDLIPNETRNEVYSYGAGRFTHRDFKKYVVSIEVTKVKPQPETEPTSGHKTTDNGTVNKNNAAQIAERLFKLMDQNNFTQDDYSLAIDWIAFTFNDTMLPAYNRMLARRLQNLDSDDIQEEIDEIASQFRKMSQYVKEAYDDDDLNDANKEKFDDVSSDIRSATVF